jgi:hypothetical protein
MVGPKRFFPGRFGPSRMIYGEAQNLDEALSIIKATRFDKNRSRVGRLSYSAQGSQKKPVTLPKFSWDKEE